MGKAAVLHQLLTAARVGRADVGRDDDVGRPRIFWRQPRGVVVKREAGAIVDLPDAGSGPIVFQKSDSRVGVRRICQPQQRNVVLSGTNAAAVGVFRGRHGGVQLIGDQGRGRETVHRLSGNRVVGMGIDGRLSVLGRQDDHRVLLQMLGLDGREHFANPCVDEVQRPAEQRAGCEAVREVATGQAVGDWQLLGRRDGLEVHAEDRRRPNARGAAVVKAVDLVDDSLDLVAVVLLGQRVVGRPVVA